MTWTKLSDDFPEDCARAELTDAQFRVHVEGLIWSMRRENGGQLDRLDIRKGIQRENPWDEINVLVALGWWTATDRGWQIRHHMQHQPSPEVIDKRRQDKAERQRKYRDKQGGPA